MERDWPATRQDRQTARALLTRAPFAPDRAGKRHPNAYKLGVDLTLDWLGDQRGQRGRTGGTHQWCRGRRSELAGCSSHLAR